MNQYYRFDPDGYYLPGHDYLAEEPEACSTDKPPLTSEGAGMYNARFNGVEDGEAPPPVPQPPSVAEEVAMLKAHVKELEDMVVFLTMPGF